MSTAEQMLIYNNRILLHNLAQVLGVSGPKPVLQGQLVLSQCGVLLSKRQNACDVRILMSL